MDSSNGDTIPKLVVGNYLRYDAKKVAMRRKALGTWQEYTWKDYYQAAKRLCLGLVSLGLSRLDKVAIIGDNSPEWYWAEVAVQAARGVVVGLFPDASLDEAKYIIDHSDARFAIVEDQEQVDKLIAIKEALPNLERVIYWEGRGLRRYTEPYLMSWDDVLEQGRRLEEAQPGLFDHLVQVGEAGDLALLSYTSGTTGRPKGAMIDHRNLLTAAKVIALTDPWRGGDNYLSYVSLAIVAEHVFGLGCALLSGAIVNFAEEPETVQENIREIGPHFLPFLSRHWEGMCSTVQARTAEATFLKRVSYRAGMHVAYKVIDADLKGRKALLWRALHPFFYWLLLRPLKDKLGLLRTRTCTTGGAALSSDVLRFYHAMGVPLRQAYGMTETLALGTIHHIENLKVESIGQVRPGLEMKVDDNGELLIKSPALFLGYYKNGQATQEKFADGWLRTGDAGYIDEEGHVYFWDRLEHLMELGEGIKYSPTYIEGRLKFSQYIGDAMVVGGRGKPYLAVIVAIDFQNVSKWAERRRIAYTTYADLSQKTAVGDLVEQELVRVNKTLPDHAKIRRFVLLHKEFDPDDAELTRSRKLRRSYVEARYRDMIEAIYTDRGEFLVETEVTYADGKKALTCTTVGIRTLAGTQRAPKASATIWPVEGVAAI